MKKFYFIFIIVLLLFAFSAHAGQERTLEATVMQLKDGDTAFVIPAGGGQGFICRLYGIDAPEKDQPFGQQALKELKKLVLGQAVTVETTGAKTYNREVCLLKKNGKDINLEMVRLGYAWAYVQYLKRPHASEYIEVERKAREKKLGLWQQNNPTPPWEWRKRGR